MPTIVRFTPQPRPLAGLFMAVVVALTVAGCGTDKAGDGTSSGSAATKSLAVSAAASLTEVLPKIDSKPTFQFAGSDTLATQITEGAKVDVFAAANTKLPDKLHADGTVDKPVKFAANHIVIVVPTDSKITTVGDLAADKSATIVVARPGVPLGDYTTQVLDALHLSAFAKRAKSQEADAKSVTAKVALGEADAGFVYVTDAQPLSDKLRVIELPETDANHAVYEVAVVSASKHKAAARAFIAELTSLKGQDALQDAGFDLPN